MKTEIVIGCPKCGVENRVEMEIMESVNSISDIISMVIPGIKQYSFNGETKCSSCSEDITVLLTVGAGKKLMGVL